MSSKNGLQEAVKLLDDNIVNASQGLPDEVFYFISRTTPLINVDLLIKDENGRTLLAWRDDPYAGTGWHVPGGIIRYKETFETRIQKVAETEIGCRIQFEPDPIAVNQMIHQEHRNRGHFISLLYQCYLESSFSPANKGLNSEDAGYLEWHAQCPDNMIVYHDVYKTYIRMTHPQEIAP